MPSCELPGCRSKQRAQVREDGRKLCDRCFQKEIEASENVTNDEVEDEDRPASDVPRLVINELLMYCDNHVKNSSRDAIKRVVIDFYTPEEIGNAKTILWELYGEEMLGTIPNRQDSVNRGAHEKETDDILSALYTISNDSEPDFVKIQFVANCFSRLPRVAPEEIDLTSIVMRLTQLERNQTSLERKVASNVDNISAVMEAQFQLNGYSAVAQRQVQHVSPGDTVRRSSQPPVQPSRIALTSSQPNATAPSLTQPPLSGPVSTGPDDQPSTRDSAASGTAVESSAVDSEGFQKPRDQRVRERRQARTNARTALYGSNESSGTLRAGKQMRELFVFNLDQETTETDLIEYLKVKGIETSEVECKSNENATNKSFRIVIYKSDNEKVMNTDMWPSRVGIRPFYRSRSGNDSNRKID